MQRISFLRALRLMSCLFWLLSLPTAGAGALRPGELEPLDAQGLQAILEAGEGRVVLLNFWATWCRPCLKEIPDLMALVDEFGPERLMLVAVSLDDVSYDESMVRDFIRDRFPGFSSWISTEAEMDSIVSVADPAWNEVLPTSYVINASGVVDMRLQGGKSREEFAAAIQASLKP